MCSIYCDPLNNPPAELFSSNNGVTQILILLLQNYLVFFTQK